MKSAYKMSLIQYILVIVFSFQVVHIENMVLLFSFVIYTLVILIHCYLFIYFFHSKILFRNIPFHNNILLLPVSIRVLRWLKTVSSTFQDVDFDGLLLPLFIN